MYNVNIIYRQLSIEMWEHLTSETELKKFEIAIVFFHLDLIAGKLFVTQMR